TDRAERLSRLRTGGTAPCISRDRSTTRFGGPVLVRRMRRLRIGVHESARAPRRSRERLPDELPAARPERATLRQGELDQPSPALASRRQRALAHQAPAGPELTSARRRLRPRRVPAPTAHRTRL